MPGATETEFFERADMIDTKVGQRRRTIPPMSRKIGFEAMMKGEGDVVSRLEEQAPDGDRHRDAGGVLAEQHRKQAEPGSGKR